LGTTSSINGKKYLTFCATTSSRLKNNLTRHDFQRRGNHRDWRIPSRGGGKRIRPRFCCSPQNCWIQRRGASGSPRSLRSSTRRRSFTTTLLTRHRSGAAVRGQYAMGNSMCVLAGDWLYMQRSRSGAGAEFPDPRCTNRTYATDGGRRTTADGKAREADFPAGAHDLIYRKTACLFSVCMRVGGILGGATEDEEQRLGQYGRDLGWPSRLLTMCLTLRLRKVS